MFDRSGRRLSMQRPRRVRIDGLCGEFFAFGTGGSMVLSEGDEEFDPEHRRNGGFRKVWGYRDEEIRDANHYADCI